MKVKLVEDYNEAPHNMSFDWYKQEIKKRRPWYTFDKLEKSRNKEQVVYRILDRIIKEDKRKELDKEYEQAVKDQEEKEKQEEARLKRIEDDDYDFDEHDLDEPF